jgi:hypothetical protein
VNGDRGGLAQRHATLYHEHSKAGSFGYIKTSVRDRKDIFRQSQVRL